MDYKSSIEFYPKQEELWYRLMTDEYEDHKPVNTIIGFGGARGGSKSYSMRTMLLLRRLIFGYSSALIFRTTLKELFRSQIDPLFEEHPWLEEYHKKQDNKIELPNHSIIYYGYGETYEEIKHWRGSAHDDLMLDEVSEMPEHWIKFLLTTNRRSSKLSQQKLSKAFVSGNPGGPGHEWFKRVFIERDAYKHKENPKSFYFLQSYLWDNYHWIADVPGIPQVSKQTYFFEWTETQRKEFAIKYAPYVDTLGNLDEYEWQAAVEGNWDKFEGQFFSRFNADIHCIEPFDLPKRWNIVAGLDWGVTTTLEVVAADPDGNLYVVDEFFYDEPESGPDLRVKAIKKWMDENEWMGIPIIADYDVWYADTGNARNKPIQAFYDAGIRNIRKVKKQRIEDLGFRKACNEFVKDRLFWKKDREGGWVVKPRLFMFKGMTPNLVRTLPLLMTDMLKPGDFKHDSKNKQDHCFDALKYGAMNIYQTHTVEEHATVVVKVPKNATVEVFQSSNNPYAEF